MLNILYSVLQKRTKQYLHKRLQRNGAFESVLWTIRATKGLPFMHSNTICLVPGKKENKGYCNDCYWLIYVKHNEAEVSIW